MPTCPPRLAMSDGGFRHPPNKKILTKKIILINFSTGPPLTKRKKCGDLKIEFNKKQQLPLSCEKQNHEFKSLQVRRDS